MLFRSLPSNLVIESPLPDSGATLIDRHQQQFVDPVRQLIRSPTLSSVQERGFRLESVRTKLRLANYKDLIGR